MTITREFQFDRATKNTYRFNEAPPPGEEPIIGVLYIQKSAFTSQPVKVIVTIGSPVLSHQEG